MSMTHLGFAVVLAVCLIFWHLWFAHNLEVLETTSNLLFSVMLVSCYYVITSFAKDGATSIVMVIILAAVFRLAMNGTAWRLYEGTFFDLARQYYSCSQLGYIWLIGLLTLLCEYLQIDMVWKLDAFTCECLLGLQFLSRGLLGLFS